MALTLRTHENVAEIVVSGPFKFDLHAQFRQLVDDALAYAGVRSIEVNLYEADYIDSSALGMMLVLKQQANKANINDLVITGSRGTVRQVLEVARFDKFFMLR